MAATNRMQITIEEDGTITVNTEGFSAEVHEDAEGFIDMIESLAGGERNTTKLKRNYVPLGKASHNHTHHTH